MSGRKVSVIVPAYNQADFLGDAIQSVLNQTYQDFELIIVNDASPDNTVSKGDLGSYKDLKSQNNVAILNQNKIQQDLSIGDINYVWHSWDCNARG